MNIPEIIEVFKAEHIEAMKVLVYFSDVTNQRIDFSEPFASISAPAYQKWKEPKKFQQFAIENGNLVWGKDWDIIFPVEQLYTNKIK